MESTLRIEKLGLDPKLVANIKSGGITTVGQLRNLIKISNPASIEEKVVILSNSKNAESFDNLRIEKIGLSAENYACIHGAGIKTVGNLKKLIPLFSDLSLIREKVMPLLRAS